MKRSFHAVLAAAGIMFSGAVCAQVVGYVDNPQTNSTDWATAVAGLGSSVNNNVDFESHPLGALQSDFYTASDGVTLTAAGAIGDVVFGSGPNDGNTSGSNPGEGSHPASNYLSVSPQQATLTITFASPTYGAGLFTIDKFWNSNSLPMTIEAFTGPDGTGTSLGQFSAPSLNFQPDNLYFMGVTSAAGDIQSLVFSYDGSTTGDSIGLDNIVFAGEGGDGPSGVVQFGTTIDFTNGFDGMVAVTITCNAGTPLQQSFEISESTSVTFTVQNLIPTPDTRCEVTSANLADGYTSTATANGAVVADTCVFVGGTPATGESGFSVSGVNSCDIEAEPDPTTVSVNTTVEGDDDPAIDTSFTTTIVCENVSADTGPVFGTVTEEDTSGSFTANWYADPVNGTDCTVTLVPNDMAVEGSTCSFSFAIGDAEAGCDVAGTVFFEGIPTLSQYGMAIMVLLMLGVGFVGMRRFV